MSTLNQHNRVGEVYGSVTTLIVITTISVILRLFARKISAAPFWWDDWTIIGALITFYGLVACVFDQVRHYGLGRHTVLVAGPIDQNKSQTFLKLFLAEIVLYITTSMVFRTSLILLYYRLFGSVRGFRYILIVAECIVAGYWLSCSLVAIFQCKPISYNWDKTIPGTCISSIQFYRWNGVGNLFIDFMILCLTFPVVWRLNIAFRQKITLTCIFLLGTFVWVASIVRVTTFDQFKVEDITYTLLSPAIWSVTEQALGITCTCLPTLRPLFGRILSGRTKPDARGTLNSARRHEIQLLKLSGKPTVKRSSGDESSRGFARLPEENMVLSSVTSYATAGLKNDEEVIPKAILKSQRIEQHYENAEGV